MDNRKLAEYVKENTLNHTLTWDIKRKMSHYPIFNASFDTHIYETNIEIANVPVTLESTMAKINKNRTEYNLTLKSAAGPLGFIRGPIAEDVYKTIQEYLTKQREELKKKIESIF